MRAIILGFAIALAAIATALATPQRYDLVCQLSAGCVDAKGVTQSQNTVMNVILLDAASAFTPPTGTAAVLETSQTAASTPPPAATPSITPTPPERLAQIMASIANNKNYVLAQQLNSPNPSPSCQIPAVAGDTCYVGQIHQALALLTLNRSSADVTNAISYLQSAVTGIPTDANFGNLTLDQFHFVTAESLYRADMKFGPSGTGAINSTLHGQIAALFFRWGSLMCPYATAYPTNPPTTEFAVYGSENHGLMHDTACLAAAELWANTPAIASNTYPDGTTASQSLAEYTQRITNLLTYYPTNGPMMEAYSPTYSPYTTQALLTLYDVVPNTTINGLAKNLLDYWLMTWTLGQVDGAYGGAMIRQYTNVAVTDTYLAGIAWLYTKQWTAYASELTAYGAFALSLSSYVPPQFLIDMALDKVGRGRYENLFGTVGVQTQPFNSVTNYYHIAINGPTFFGYGYMTPEYSMGAVIAPYVADTTIWSAISTQNWAEGVAFGGNTENVNRVVVQAGPATGSVVTNAGERAIASKGAMIVEGMAAPYSKYVDHLDVWIGNTMTVVEQDASGHTGWVFAYCPTGYVAIKALSGAYSWGTPQNSALDMTIPTGVPIVVQAAGVSDYASFSAFQSAVYATSPTYNGGTGLASYTGLSPAAPLTLNTQSGAITVNGQLFNFGQQIAWSSPLLNQPWGAQAATFFKGAQSYTFSFAH